MPTTKTSQALVIETTVPGPETEHLSARMDVRRLELLIPAFLEAMNDLMRYGQEKYGDLPATREKHACPARVYSGAMEMHAADHFQMYLMDIPHDHFGTQKHQLAAVAVNAMMEFHFEGLESE